MNFLLYLSPEGMDVYNMVSRKVRVVENAPVCRKYDIFGFYSAQQKTLTMCTSKIQNYENISKYIHETLMHESTHVAQSCRTNFRYLTPFGINSSSMYLNSSKENDLKRVVAFNPSLKDIDREAFWMEDKPNEVKHVLKKYCF